MTKLAPSLHGIELVDDPTAVGTGHPPGTTREGLRLLPYAIAPHHRSDHPAAPAINRLVEHYTQAHIPHRTLRDGQVILIDGHRHTLLS